MLGSLVISDMIGGLLGVFLRDGVPRGGVLIRGGRSRRGATELRGAGILLFGDEIMARLKLNDVS
jgi:hypothetical protein